MTDSGEGFELEITWQIRIKIYSCFAAFLRVWSQTETSFIISKVSVDSYLLLHWQFTYYFLLQKKLIELKQMCHYSIFLHYSYY